MKVAGTAWKSNFFNAASVLMYKVCSFPSAVNWRLTSVICAPVALLHERGRFLGVLVRRKGRLR